MTTINRKQPMRPAEIDLLNQVDTNTADIAMQTERLTQEIADRTNGDNVLQSKLTQEIADRTNGDNVLQSNIDAEAKARADADTTLQQNIDAEAKARADADTTLQTSIDAEAKARADADTTLQTSINSVNDKFPVQNANIGDLQVTNEKLEQAIQDQLTFLKSVPAQEFGTSNAIDVQANSNMSINISFERTKTEAPIVLCGLQHASGNLSCIVTDVTNQQFSVTVYNLSSTDVSGITIDWLAISGR